MSVTGSSIALFYSLCVLSLVFDIYINPTYLSVLLRLPFIPNDRMNRYQSLGNREQQQRSSK